MGIIIVAFNITPTAQWWQRVTGIFVYGFGVGLATGKLTSVVLMEFLI